jgi:hypothetical protein
MKFKLFTARRFSGMKNKEIILMKQPGREKYQCINQIPEALHIKII